MATQALSRRKRMDSLHVLKHSALFLLQQRLVVHVKQGLDHQQEMVTPVN
jgi:hypothetical protein